MWNGINRRRFPRANYKCLISIKKRLTAKTISTHTENIGAGGICVLLKEDLGLFQGVDVELFIDEKGPQIKCGGTLVWVVKKTDPKQKGSYYYDTGIEFIDIRPEDRDKISDIIDEILKVRRQK
ncbi:MAG: PilZ domain-containing protein [Candidatus Omnitrophica bacterium]|nr:PilZ domain-containing protein [Candidatus Omnitrophota bacterium]